VHLAELNITNLRCIEQARLCFAPGLNLIYGDNAAGKTSLLEAIFFLAHARSFRETTLDALPRHGSEVLRISGQIVADGRNMPIGVERRGRQLLARIDRKPAPSVSSLAQHLPVLVVHPGSDALVLGGPGERRAFLDWGCFHDSPAFHPIWQRFRRALEQRNQLLRLGRASRELGIWTETFIQAAVELTEARQAYLSSLEPFLDQAMEDLELTGRIGLQYRRGWTERQTLPEVLHRHREVELRRGFTQVGPQRAELDIQLDGEPAAQTASRGQIKTLVAALRLAQAGRFNRIRGESALFLVDDLPSELDSRHRQRLLQALQRLGAQGFITAIEPDSLDSTDGRIEKMFHVKQGGVTELV
jgi:DNA replication and repair protein RecF